MKNLSGISALSLLFFLLISLHLFFTLGDFGITDPDETFYAETAKEMLVRDEWLTPYIHDESQFEKPIFFYWMVEAAFKVFGVNEFAARFPSALTGLLGLLAMYFLGKMLFNERVGLFSALIFATSIEYIVLSRACVTDMALSTFMLAGFLFFLYGHLRGKKVFYLASSLGFALATLTKGPIGILLPAAIILLYLIITKDLTALKRVPIGGCLVVFLLIAAPWYLIMYKMHSKDFMNVFFGFHNITRFLAPEHEVGSQFYYNIPNAFVGLFPWSVFLPIGLLHAFKTTFANRDEKRGKVIFLLLWFFIIFIFFSASSTKLPTYIFPSYPALAILTALIWDDFLRGTLSKNIARWMKYSYYILPVAIVFAAIGLYMLIDRRYPNMLADATIAGSFLIFGAALSLVAFRAKEFLLAFFLTAFSVILFLYPFTMLVLPEMGRYETSKEISQKLLSLVAAGEPIGAEKHYRAGLAFYTNRPIADLDRHHYITRFLNSDERAWCVLKEKNHMQLYDRGINEVYVKPTYMVYKMGKKAIITNAPPRNGRYMIKREWSE